MRGWVMLSIGVAWALGACTFTQPNPERRMCMDECRVGKNACMLEASTAGEIGTCDEGFRVCIEPCAAMPRTVPLD